MLATFQSVGNIHWFNEACKPIARGRKEISLKISRTGSLEWCNIWKHFAAPAELVHGWDIMFSKCEISLGMKTKKNDGLIH